MNIEDLDEAFHPYERLVNIDLCGTIRQVPENNSVLRGFQFLSVESISYGDFCWNGECLNCQVVIRSGDKEKVVIACRTDVVEGMEIVRVSQHIEFGGDEGGHLNT